MGSFFFLNSRANRRHRRADGRRARVEGLEERRLLSNGFTFEPLASFAAGDSVGSSPQSEVALDKNGNVFGFTSNGGANGTGAAYEIQEGNTIPVLLASFPAAVNGVTPVMTGPVIDSQGDLFGVSSAGGDSNQDGTIFEIAKGTNAITTLAQFSSATTGRSPGGTLIMDSSGDLFGTTANGGANGSGTVWELARGNTSIVPLASFSPVMVNGVAQNPGANSIAMDSGGDLFGTTSGNVSVGSDGTLWEVPAGTNAIQTLADFGGASGIMPVGSIAVDHNGNVFGVTQFGGDDIGGASSPNGSGVLWEFPAGAGQLVTLNNFDNSAGGEFPIGGVELDSKGDLFGTTSAGGNASASFTGDGTVWELPAQKTAIKTIEIFNGTTGATPRGGIAVDAFGDAFSTASSGGSSGGGEVFEMSLGGASESVSSLTLNVARTTLPASIPGGTTTRGIATLDVVNSSGDAVRGSFTLGIFASLSGAIDATSIEIGSMTRALTVPAGATKVFDVPISSFSTQSLGTYSILAQASDSAGNTSGAGTGTTINVEQPFISLSEKFARITLPSSVVGGTPQHAEAILEVTNNGNITAAGSAQFAISPLDVSEQLADVSRRISIPAGKTVMVSVPIKQIPTEVTGSFPLSAQVIDPVGGTSATTSPTTYSFTPPMPALAATIETFTPTAVAAGATSSVKATIVISNDGNVPIDASHGATELSISFGVVNNPPPFVAMISVNLPTFTRATRFGLGQKRTFSFSFTTTQIGSLAAGTYFPAALVTVGTSVLTNATSAQTITVS